MSTIDPKDIDEWLFNYFEGKLTHQEGEALIRLMNASPALKADYDAWKASYVVEAPITYPNADQLLRKVPATVRRKWMALGVVLVLALALLMFFLQTEPVKKEVPEEPAKEQPAIPPAPIETPLVAAPRNEENAKQRASERLGNVKAAGNTRKGISPDSTGSRGREALAPVMMQRRVSTEMPATDQAYTSDSLEIMIKPLPASHPAGNSAKQKTRKKPMTVIRIRDTGF